MFLRTMRKYPLARSYTYVNADILMDITGFVATVNTVQNVDEFLMVGRRTNVAWTEEMTVGDESFDFDYHFVSGELFQVSAEDYFTVSSGAIDWQNFPDVVVGRIGYDNMLVDHVFHKKGVSLIDVTRTVRAIHQTDREGVYSGRTRSMDEEDRMWNMQFGLHHDHGFTTHADMITVHCDGGSVCLRHSQT